MAPNPTTDPRLPTHDGGFSAEWLQQQRWYRAKSQAIDRVALMEATELPLRDAWLLLLEVVDASGARAEYLVPAVSGPDGYREPRDGEGIWRTIAQLIARGETLTGAGGVWRFVPSPFLASVVVDPPAAIGHMAERRLGGEQSNTSVALGERLLLKVYRLREPGAHPELEVNAFLSGAGFAHVPRLGGSATHRRGNGEAGAVAILQELVANQGDAWRWMLGLLAEGSPGQAAAIAGVELIGRVTAELHAALASRPTTPGFPDRPATAAEPLAWQAAAERQLAGALAVLDGAPGRRLAGLVPRLRASLAAIGRATGASVSRIHGDYHLGQLLRTATGVAVIDFEGEPARALSERRAPASPLRDVAGMLRSLEYAAETVAHQHGAAPMPGEWLRDARDAFVAGYGGLTSDQRALCRAFEIEKACYEVRYEANNRPAWTWLPLRSLERLAR